MGGRGTGRSCAHPMHGFEDRIENVGNRLVDVDGGMSLLGGERFECRQLRIEQIRGHELMVTAGQVVGDDLAGTVEVDEDE